MKLKAEGGIRRRWSRGRNNRRKEAKAVRCKVCGKELPYGEVLTVDCGTKVEVCTNCAHTIKEVGKMIDEKVFVSEAASEYLRSDELREAFCGDCPWNIYHPGYFNPLSSAVDPPWNECPADLDISSDKCYHKSDYEEIVALLAEADDVAGMRKVVRVL